MNGWMDEWATSFACYFFIERPLRWATSSLSSLLSGLLLLWPCSELHPRQLFGSFSTPILLFVQLLAASSCNPAKQERRSITHALLRAAVPMCFVAAGCKPDSAICTSKSQKRSCSEHFWKIRSAKCAPDCSESSICTSTCLKRLSRSEQFWKMRWAKWAPDCSESSISHKIRKKNISLSLQSPALFVDNFARSRPAPAQATLPEKHRVSCPRVFSPVNSHLFRTVALPNYLTMGSWCDDVVDMMVEC